MAIQGLGGNFLRNISSPMTGTGNLASKLGQTLSSGAHTAHAFSNLAHKYSPQNLPNTLINTFVRPHLHHASSKLTSPFTQMHNSAQHATYQFNNAVTMPFRMAEQTVTRPIRELQNRMNSVLNHAQYTVAHPFVAAQHTVAAPGNMANQLLNNSFGKVFHGVHGIENSILSALKLW